MTASVTRNVSLKVAQYFGKNGHRFGKYFETPGGIWSHTISANR